MICLDEKKDFLARLYGGERVELQIERYTALQKLFRETFGTEAESLFSAPGRTEIGGNHTDHQNGCVFAAGVDMDTIAAVRRTGDGRLRLYSDGLGWSEISLNELAAQPGEQGTTAALIRGVAAGLAARGCGFEGAGLEVCVTTHVPAGSGLSSSAAFEILIGTILNELYFDGRCTAVQLAEIGQYAENVYFGKPSGLMDQMASSVGGAVFIDFKEKNDPQVEALRFDLSGFGMALCILDSHADHRDLTAEYAAIPAECAQISGFFGKKVLREVEQKDFLAAVPELRKRFGDRAVLRAIHFFNENERAQQEASAIRSGDLSAFLQLVRESGRSSAMYLQNIVPGGAVKSQELLLTIALAEKLLGEKGAVRVHGGGFGGTAQAFVPLEMLESFRTEMDAFLGAGSCHVLTVRPVGGVRIA